MNGPRSLPGRVAFRLLHLAANRAMAGVWRWRRRRLLMALGWRAWWGRAEVRADVAPDLRLGRGVRVTVEAGTANRLRIGPRARIGARTRIELRGGRIDAGPGLDLREGCRATVAGHLRFEGPVLAQPFTSIHCDESVEVGAGAGLGEFVTVIDSTHSRTGPHEWWLDNLRTAPVSIGRDAWIGAKATVGRGVTVGDRAVIAANSLVVVDVPPGRLASGVPAEVRQPVPDLAPASARPMAAPGRRPLSHPA